MTTWMWTVPGRPGEIRARLDAVEELLRPGLREDLARQLSGVGDLERMVARLAADKANARDLRNLAAALEVLPGLRLALEDCASSRLRELRDELDPLPEALALVDQSIVENPPLQTGGGGMIRDGVNSELDELREIIASGRDWLRRFEQREREAAGIQNLKVKFNKVFGYHIEISKSNLDKVPQRYMRRQTLVNAERFITDELKGYEEKVLGAEERIENLELEIFRSVVERLRPHFQALQTDARKLGELDLMASLAECAGRYGYCKPVMVEEGEFHLKAARHPVVERVLPPGETFVPNDVVLSGEREQLLLITGPNMAGKSTYLRMVGLITLMAHMGSFVPAEQATIPLRDQIFTRVGASDNLARGESTFLVEMNEAAFILNNATPRSLVLLDEIGRGTSTFDGLSLAWAITEYLHNHPESRALTLFATHYHELVNLEHSLVRLRNYNIVVRRYGDRMVFTRQVEPGGCSHSYGIDVARMAGLPRPVLDRARQVLHQLEFQEYTSDLTPRLQSLPAAAEPRVNEQLLLFSAPDQDLREQLRQADVDRMTPLQAMELLIELKRQLD